MDKTKNINPVGPGAIGDIRIYERQGRTVVRARHNSKKPNNKTLDSLGQKTRYMNVVKSWSAFGGLLKGNFELKPANQTDYNAFQANNLPNAQVYLTKEEVAQGACVVDNFVISRGSIEPRVEITERDGIIVSNIAVGDMEITLDTRLDWLAGKIIMENKGFYRTGDEILFLRATQEMTTRSVSTPSMPQFHAHAILLPLNNHYPITLREHLQAFGSEGFVDGFRNVGGFLTCQKAENSLVAWVHRRPVAGRPTQVSTQSLYGTNLYLTNYATDEARLRAIATYNPKPSYIAPPPLPVVNPFEMEPGADTPEVTISVLGGSGGGTCRVGTRVEIKAQHVRGMEFSHWRDGDCSPVRTVVAFSDITYEAIYRPDPLAILR